MKEIRGDAKTIRSLLAGAKYSIDYYQREYRWQTKQVSELLDDLGDKFFESYDAAHERSAVERYGHYFLGSIIISDKDGSKFIIDGQQRLTTLTLLLIHLHHLLTDSEQKSQLSDLIFSQRFGRKSFNLDVAERTPSMDALYSGQPFDDSGQPESVRNIVARYRDIEEQFPEKVTGTALSYFVDWLIENVHLVEITAYSDEDAYTIFETMNDRGLSLTPTDMLKGYLLANITEPERRNRASLVWKERIGELADFGKEEDADGIKSWLRSQHAENIRERRAGAVPRDFDLIGTEFHRWVRDHQESLGLRDNSSFTHFIERDFAFYTRWYLKLREAGDRLTPGLETVYYNAENRFTLQYPLLLAALRVEDSEEVVLRKVRAVASYVDILITRRIWNWRAIDYSTMQYATFLVIKEIRGLPAPAVAQLLTERLAKEEESFTSNGFSMHGTNGRQVRRLLARMTDYVETRSGLASRYLEYVERRGKNAYEVEHVWANHPERHQDEFGHATEFREYRSRIGGLLLLPKSFNASYGDLPYPDKREQYNSQNLLARSLHERSYEHNPGFRRFLEESGLPFRAHPHFKKADLDARQELYRSLAEQIWNPARLALDAGQ